MKQMFKRIFGSQAAKPPIEVEKIEVQMSEFNFEKYVPQTNTTIVYLPAIDFHSERFGRRPQRLLRELAAIGYHVIYINSSDEFYQVDALEYPHPELPNFVVARVGQNVRPLFQGERVIYWVNDSRLASSVETSYPNLVVFDSLTDPDRFEKDKHKMEAVADVVFITPERIYEHGKYCSHVHLITADEFEIKERAEQIAQIIDELPNRPAPLM
ncbi:hypothetical protein Q0V21_03605 [Paenibacillus sp. 11B]|uniref:hypothetical protein n=1 Tax=Paenibacillus TaxID=44249 RepID=UPI000BA18941|nr:MULTISPECIES: hypothetical protein [Paenibacillus]MDN8587848.1 hypothetical protein [Paenibacillus sp. 11B]OZQ72423.1 hypothetical protein CA599_06415 [Paenibacillus taichungensis]HBU85809.1 hypothetical protein [Paenibacillus sp.]